MLDHSECMSEPGARDRAEQAAQKRSEASSRGNRPSAPCLPAACCLPRRWRREPEKNRKKQWGNLLPSCSGTSWARKELFFFLSGTLHPAVEMRGGLRLTFPPLFSMEALALKTPLLLPLLLLVVSRYSRVTATQHEVLEQSQLSDLYSKSALK